MDEDLTMEERKRRWRMVEMARRERAKGKKVEISNRKLRVEGRRWT